MTAQVGITGSPNSEPGSGRAAGAEANPSGDAELARRARGGDRAAFSEVYLRYAPVVHGVLVAHAPWREVPDLVQDVFVLALRAIGALDEPERLGPWLIAIARNRARDHLKRRRPEVQHEAELERAPMPSPRAPDDTDGDDDPAAAAILAAVQALPESYRETLALRLVEGLSGPEIAARTGLTHGSVRVNLHRGFRLLRERLEQREGRRTS